MSFLAMFWFKFMEINVVNHHSFAGENFCDISFAKKKKSIKIVVINSKPQGWTGFQY